MHCSTPFPCALRHEFHPANSVIGFLSGGLPHLHARINLDRISPNTLGSGETPDGYPGRLSAGPP